MQRVETLAGVGVPHLKRNKNITEQNEVESLMIVLYYGKVIFQIIIKNPTLSVRSVEPLIIIFPRI